MLSRARLLSPAASAIVLGLLPAVLGGGEGHGGHDGYGGHGMADMPKEESEYPPTYFAHLELAGVMYAHIALMVLCWVFILPVAVMFSIAGSRHTLVVQFVFLAFNAIGVLLATIYDAQTPDLYPNNAHHKIGWVITFAASAHVLVSLLGWATGAFKKLGASSHNEHQGFMPLSTHANDIRYRSHNHGYEDRQCSGNDRPSHDSNDSGHGTDSNPESLRSHSVETLSGDIESPLPSHQKEYDDDDDDMEELSLSSPTQPSFVTQRASKIVDSRFWKYVILGYRTTDRIILPFGFIALTTGIVTYARFFEGAGIFGGLAHWVKGGVFFWLGLFTLGRWSGSFGELGWAWNARLNQPGQKWRPSAEFVESFLIFFYGSTNIFLEHLGNWGGAWHPQDLEHFSITVLFIGGGLCGMLIESSSIRDLLNASITQTGPEYTLSEEEREQLEPPATYKFSLNPIPALVIMLLGIMMSSHTQESATSTMVHKQWGNLLTGASFARGITYIIMYLKPPKSALPSRPPTELLAAFGLISGGIMFMVSASDVVQGIIHYQLDAMFMYTVTMGLVGLLMAWEIIVLAIKGLAVRQERRAGHPRAL